MPLKYFNESEFNQFKMMDKKLLNMLDNLREAYGSPIKITSSYRSPDHPIEAKKKVAIFSGLYLQKMESF